MSQPAHGPARFSGNTIGAPSAPAAPRRAQLWALGLILTLLTPAISQAFESAPSEADTEPKVTAYLSHSALAPGASGHLLALLKIPENFHIQKNLFLEMLVPDEAPVVLGALSAPGNAEWDGEPVLRGEAPLASSFTVKPDASPGTVTFTLTVGYQGCTEGPVYACYPPSEAQLPLTLEILSPGGQAREENQELFAAHASVVTGKPAADDSEGPADDIGEPAEGRDLAGHLSDALAKGSLLAFALVFLGGVLSSLTPCVYPMIPITISYVGGRAKSRLEGFILALFFVLGLAIMYSVLGLAAASTGAVFGSIMQSPAALIIVAAIFAIMGASMLGAFDIVLPSRLTTGLTSASSGAGAKGGSAGAIIGAILMGMTTGLVASPCVGPVLVVLLTFVAQTGNLLYGFWLLFTFACGLGVLFLFLGTFAGAISALPGAGSWMDTVKHFFGVILIGMAIFFLRGILGPAVTRFLLGVFLVFVGVFIGAFTPLPEEPRYAQLWRKALGILIFLSGAVVFLLWLCTAVGVPMPSGPATGGPGIAGGVAAHPEPAWLVNDEDALERARLGGQPAIQDFYADWCAACVELDEKTWSDPEVLAESERFTAIKMDFTKRGEFEKAATARYEVRGMPTVIFYDSQGHEVTRFFGFKPPGEVLEIMRAIH
jgi:thiol:disulfide interchange protein DsbD